MSIIYDALKKVEQSTDKDPKTTAQERHNPKIKIVLLYSLVGILGLAIGNLLFGLFLHQKQNQSLPVKTETQAQPAKAIVEAAKTQPPAAAEITTTQEPKPSPAPETSRSKKDIKDKLVLNGIFFSHNQGFALINNRIVEVGDKIDDAQVKRIDAREVEVEVNGTSVLLTTGDR